MKPNLSTHLSEEQRRILAAIAENPCCTGGAPTSACAGENVDSDSLTAESDGEQDDPADRNSPTEE